VSGRGDRLIERDEPLARLEDALASASAGAGKVACIEGAAGVGKSRLLAEFGSRADARLELHARGFDTERDLPFAVVRQLYEPALAALDEPERRRVLSGPGRSAAWVLGGVEPPATVPDQAAAVLHGIAWVTLHLAASRTVVLRVDDLHWADPASLRALAYLAPRIGEHHVLLACAMRPGGTDDSPELLGPAATPGAIVVRLGALSEDGSRRVVRERLGPAASDRFCAACHRSTGGNPQLLRELLADVQARGVRPDDREAERIATVVPEGVARTVVRRLALLSPPARALARAVAVLGRAELRHAAALAEVPEDEVRGAVEELTTASIVGHELPLEFVHPILGEAVGADIPAGARDVYDRQAASLLAEEHAYRERAAAHLLACEPRGERWAADVLYDAGSTALDRGAPDAAARAFDRALAERSPERPAELLARLGHAQMAAGERAGAAVIDEAIAATHDQAARAALVSQVGQAEFIAGQTDAALRRLADAVAAPGLSDEAVRAIEDTYLFLGRQDARFSADVRRRLADRDERRAADDPVLAAHLAIDSFYSGEPAALVARRAHLGMRDPLSARAGPVAAPFMMANFALAGTDAFGEAETAIEEVLARASDIGSLVLQGLTVHMRLWVRWRRGALAGAEEDARAVLAGAGAGVEHATLPARWALSDILLDRDRAADAHAVLDPHVEPALDEYPGSQSAAWILMGRARLRFEAGDVSAALEDALRVGELTDDLQIPNPAFTAWRSLAARAAARLGDHGRARALAGEEVELARRFGAPRALGIALTGRGLAEERPEDALRWLEEAAGILASSPALVERARTLLEVGAALRRARRPREARLPLRQALDVALDCPAEALAARARAELEASGARPRRDHTTGLDALTPRERQVADLAAAGQSNGQIAAGLVVSRGTVEAHLRSVFRKLDIASRHELPDALRHEP
jgi:DNA-binding CsgD family transcriptional regulator